MSNRTLVLAEQIRQILSSALCFKMRDPQLEGVTFTRAKVSSDLQFADILFTYPEEDKKLEAVSHALNRAKGAFKRIIAQKIKLRRVPDLRFHPDDDLSAERRIGAILAQLEIPPQEEDED